MVFHWYSVKVINLFKTSVFWELVICYGYKWRFDLHFGLIRFTSTLNRLIFQWRYVVWINVNNFFKRYIDRLINIQFIFFSRICSQFFYFYTYINAFSVIYMQSISGSGCFLSVLSFLIILEWGMGTGCWLLFIYHYLFVKHSNCRNDPPVLKKLVQGYNSDRAVVWYW